MVARSLRRHLAAALWYLGLPLALSVGVLVVLDDTGALEGGVAPWHFLIAFAAFELIAVIVRDAFPTVAQAGDVEQVPGSVLSPRRAQRVLAEAERLFARNRQRIGTNAREAVEGAIASMRSTLLEGGHDELRSAAARLEQTLDHHLGFARRSRAREYLEIIGIAVTVALLFRAFVVEPFKIPTGSMIPTLQIGDHIFVDKFVYGLHLPFLRVPVLRGRTPERGDVIVFMYPRDPSKDFIKRVVGVPGDVVEVRGERIVLNGRPLPRCLVGEEQYVDVDALTGAPAQRTGDLFVEFSGETPYLTLYDRDPPARRDRPPYRVGRGELFAMGDNRDNSRDSRQWGAVPVDYVKGRAHWIWWSFGEGGGSRFDRIGHSILGAPDVPLALRSALTRCIARGPSGSTTDVALLP